VRQRDGRREREDAAAVGPRVEQLEERGIIVAPREGVVRFSPNFYDTSEVGRILAAVDGIE
jgi:hypothetical protein